MITPLQFLTFIIRPVLQDLGLASPAAERLLLGTAAIESDCGTYLSQYPAGPGLGIFQMELATIHDLYTNFLAYRPQYRSLADRWKGATVARSLAVIGNLHYATALARLQYYRVPAPLPDADDLEGLGAYYKQYWNTEKGKATAAQFVKRLHDLKL
jgi:hypothetical protein